MADKDSLSLYCEKCKKVMNEKNFYQSHNREKYPNNGRLNQCKPCMTMHLNNWDPATFLWILQEIDVPYIPNVWNNLMQKYASDSEKINSNAILGKYIATMKLNQWRKYRWADSDTLQELENAKAEQAMRQQGYDEVTIAKTLEQGKIPEVVAPPPAEMFAAVGSTDPLNANPQFTPEEPEYVDELTDEDRVYLKIKWGRMYKPEEWIQLETLYAQMKESYDIQTAGHEDTLKLLCKTSLKANQLIDLGDVEGFQKMSKVYDSLMKSGKFTAAQNKSESGEFVDSISELVALCEEQGFIARYYTDGPQDKVDRTLEDLKSYTRTLVTEEMNLGNLIESAIKQISVEKEKVEDEDIDDEETLFEDNLFAEGAEGIDVEDIEEWNELEAAMGLEDEKYMDDLLGGDDL